MIRMVYSVLKEDGRAVSLDMIKDPLGYCKKKKKKENSLGN